MKYVPNYPGQVCIPHQAKCKFCGKQITLYIDKDYAELRDPYGLIQLAACDRCADFKTKEIQLQDRIHRICTLLVHKKKKLSQDQLARFRQGLTNTVKSYASMVAKWKDREDVWDENCIDAIMQVPAEWASIVNRLLLLQRQAMPGLPLA